MLIIIGGRTLSALLDENINIDLLVIADATERNYILVKDYIKRAKMPMLFSESANLKIVEEHKGMKLFYSYTELINNISKRKMTHISTGGSVAHAMTSYAGNLGCNPIIFIGQDFAYTNDKMYSKVTENKDGTYKFNEVKRDDDIYVEDISGGKVRTSLILDSQRKAMEKIIKLYPDTTFINATEGGAKIEGTINMTLKQAIKKYGSEPFEKFNKIQYNIDMKTNSKIELERLKWQAENLMNIIEEKCNGNKNLNNDYIYKNIMDMYDNNNVYKLLLYDPIYNYLKTNKDYNKISDEEMFFYEVLNLLKYAIKIIEEQIDIIKN